LKTRSAEEIEAAKLAEENEPDPEANLLTDLE
jgi:hypothetical protein